MSAPPAFFLSEPRLSTSGAIPVTTTSRACAKGLVLALSILPVAAAQAPLLHYHFNEGGAPSITGNAGTLSPGPSPLIGHTLTGVAPDNTPCLRGSAGTTSEVTTPLLLNLGASSWSIGFFVRNGTAGGFQYVCSENLGSSGFRIFTGGAAGAGNIRLTGSNIGSVDIAGGAGDAGWVHVAWVHDDAAGHVKGYLNGTLHTTVAAPNVSLSSGNALLIGRSGTTCLLFGTMIEDLRFYGHALTATQVSSWSAGVLNWSPNPYKAMLSEVSWVAPRGIEISNHSGQSNNLTGWRLKWMSGTQVVVSDPIDVNIPGHDSLIVVGAGTLEPIPAVVPVINRFPLGLPATSSAYTIALLDPIGTVVDEVHVSDTVSAGTAPQAGGIFRGLALRTVGAGLRSVERIWGLDSDGGADWTEQVARTFGRENTGDGPRGTDPIPVKAVRINEICDTPACYELFNPGATAIDLSGWTLVRSSAQGTGHPGETLQGVTIAALGYVVIGTTSTPPTEIPAGVPYVYASHMWLSPSSYSCALYDSLGRVVDVVRATSNHGLNVHNHPRAPSHWLDFCGAAERFGGTIGRSSTGTDAQSGGDWKPVYPRTMGSANPVTPGAGGHGHLLDVRLNTTGFGLGFQAIIIAPWFYAGNQYGFVVSFTHSNGQGPIMGLGFDVFSNFAAFYHVAPFYGVLNSNGSGRIDFDPGTLPPGIHADFIFFTENASGIQQMTRVLEFDT
jgi:hypothetical protein